MQEGHTSTVSDASSVLIVLTDEALIYECREVPGDYADDAIRQLNAEVSHFAPETKTSWRRAITYRDRVKKICLCCGQAECLCRARP